MGLDRVRGNPGLHLPVYQEGGRPLQHLDGAHRRDRGHRAPRM